jgi:hypothetical protein
MGAAAAFSEGLTKDLPEKGGGRGIEFAGWGPLCQRESEVALAGLARFRREMSWCLSRRRDALFELTDATSVRQEAARRPSSSTVQVSASTSIGP